MPGSPERVVTRPKPSYAGIIAAEEPPPLDPLDDALNVTRALRRRGVDMHCPACEWTLDGPLGDYELVPVSDGAPDLRPTIKLAIYACRNCGYVRLHSASVLRGTLGE